MRFLRGIVVLTLACGLLLAVGGAPRPALAATVEVSGDQCSRQGLSDAIAEAGLAGVITFDCNTEINFFANEQIGISSDITIDGSNGDGDQIVFNGNDQTRFFNVAGIGSLTLANVTMKDGHGTGSGGAIKNDGGNLTIFHSTFTNNEVADDDGDSFSGGVGGAIFNSGMLTIIQSSFTNNRADYGGAIHNFDSGTATITRSSFIENSTVETAGAILNGGELTISESSFTGNAAEDGGAIRNSGTLDASQSSFTNNSASDHGGAVDIGGGTTRITSSTFSGNTAVSEGSTVYLHITSLGAEITWSTIIQPEDTKPALHLRDDLTLTGVILGGAGEHCNIDTGSDASLTDSYTIANDDSCELTGTSSDDSFTYTNGYANLGLQSPMTLPVNGIDQTIYLPIAVQGPSINGAPSAACDSGDSTNPRLDQLGNYRPFEPDCTLGAVEFTNLPPRFTSLGPAPAHANEGGMVEISATATAADQTGETITYAMDCDIADQMPPSLVNSFSCGAPDDGVFFGTATISDGIGQHTRTFLVIVHNVAPVLSPITPDTPTLVNEPVNFQMTATDVPADTLTFIYTCTDLGPPQIISGLNSNTGTFNAPGSCSYTSAGSHTIRVIALDDDSGASNAVTAAIQIGVPTTLCANNWNGSLRVDEDCDRSETMLELPEDGPITLCVNDWNGAASLGPDCNRSEYQLTVHGDGTIAICVNTWNGTLRVSDQCSRSEREDWL